MRVLFIGGTGNISAECAALLHEQGHEVLAVTRGRAPLPAFMTPVRADRTDAKAMRTALASVPADVVLNFLGYDLADVELDLELFEGRVRQYVFISSATVYAKPPPRLPITEDSPLGNRWWDYARKKLACEEWLLQQWRERGFPATIVRPSHTYSRRWIPNPVSSAGYSFAARLEQGKPVFVPDDGENPWTLTAASDFAAGLAGLTGRPETAGQAFHITSDEVLTWNQIVAEIASAVNAAAPTVLKVPTEVVCAAAPAMIGTLKGDKAHPGIFDNSKLKQWVPGYQARKPFRQGVRESVQWLREHPAEGLNPKVNEVCDLVAAARAKEEN